MERFFVLTHTQLTYYKHEAALDTGKSELGRLDVRGCTLFLKEVRQGGVFRFTIASADRELKLRAASDTVCKSRCSLFKSERSPLCDAAKELYWYCSN